MSWYDPTTWHPFTGPAQGAVNAAESGIGTNANNAMGFAGTAGQNYNTAQNGMQTQAGYLQDLANGQNSVSAEQLRQALAQNQATQQSIAASAAPQNATMAARTAAIQSGQLGAGLAGQQAVAGLQERNQANQNLATLYQNMGSLGVQGTLGGFGAANQGFGAQIGAGAGKSWWDKYGNTVLGGITGGGSAATQGGGSGVAGASSSAGSAAGNSAGLSSLAGLA